MAEEISRWESLGSIDEIVFVVHKIGPLDGIDKQNLEKYFLSENKFFRIPFSGIFSLLIFLNFLENRQGKYYLTKEGQNFKENSMDLAESKRMIILKILDIISQQENYSDFLTSYGIYFDKFLSGYVIKTSSINLKYAGLRNLLINLNFFKTYSDNPNILMLDEEYVSMVKSQLLKVRRLVSLSEFKRKQENLERVGREAEEYVLLFEQKRLQKHMQVGKIKIISEIDVSAGFDIISFNDEISEIHDRFIEVKSYADILSFYWTENEIKKSSQLGENYFLYLVDRQKINDKDYCPTIIQNPLKNVFNNKETWHRESKDWYFVKK